MAGSGAHLSAAAVDGWPLPLGDDDLAVWLTSPPGGSVSPRRERLLVVEVATLHEAETTAGRRGPVRTTPSRTVVDCLRHLDAADAVAVADAAARAGVPCAALERVLARQARWPCADRARTALALVDPRRETWLESWSVVRLHGRGVPLPQPQATVRDAQGRFVGRVDWWWPQRGVVGEADGLEEHRRAGLRTPEDAEQRLREEKRREDRLRDVGLEVVRYGTRDAVTLDELVARCERAFQRGDPGRVRGAVESAPMPLGW